MLTFLNTDSITNWDTYQSYFEIDMYYDLNLGNRAKFKRKEEIAIIITKIITIIIGSTFFTSKLNLSCFISSSSSLKNSLIVIYLTDFYQS